MRPKRASSWNISRIGLSSGHCRSISARRSGSFFPVLLRGHIGLGVPLVGRELAPAMTVQQVVSRRQRGLAPQPNIQRLLDLADNQDAARLGLLDEWLQKCRFLVTGHVLSPPPTSHCTRATRDPACPDKTRPQLARPAHRNPNGLRCLFQRQAKFQGQQDGLRLLQFLHRFCLGQTGLGLLQQFTAARSSSHRRTPFILVRVLFHY